MPTEVLAGNRFYAQVIGDGVKQLEQLMGEFARYHTTVQPTVGFVPKKGELVSAQFSQDLQWYRGRVEKVNGDKSADIFYVDFGNVRLN